MVDVWLIFIPNFHPQNPIRHLKGWCSVVFSAVAPASTLDPFWVPACLYFPFYNEEQSKTYFHRAIKKIKVWASTFERFVFPLEAILGPKLEPSWLRESPRSRPRRLPRRVWEPESVQAPKMFPKWSPRSPKMKPPTRHFRWILG